MNFIDRKTDRATLTKLMSAFPVTVILGPRQCGKTTLARTLAADSYFDLENPRDLARLEQPQLALEDLTGLIWEDFASAISIQGPSRPCGGAEDCADP